jgi:spore coat protein CotH
MHIPMKLRRYYKLLVAGVAVFVILITYFGEMRVIPYTVSADTYEQDVSDENNTLGLLGRADTDIFDEIDVMHEVEIDMDPDLYDMMILTYEETAEKEYFEVDITIDGVLYESVGIRLKGNSSLRGALSMQMGNKANNVPQEFSENDYDTPFMIKFDEYVDQDFMGYTQLSLRAQFNDTTAMQEILSYEILHDMGITAPSIVYGTVNMNGEGEQLYMLCEVINDEFIEEYMGDEVGDLFKSSGGGHMVYYDDDPTSYETYELQTNEGSSDLYDLIEMFEFFAEATEEEFLAEIDTYMDMDVYIEYLAFCNILVNLDSFAGNGNNYYLYQDPESEQFMVIPWDLNEAFGRFGGLEESRTELGLYFEEYKMRQGGGQGGMKPPGGGGMMPPEGGMMGPPPEGGMMPPEDGVMPIKGNLEIADLFFQTAYAAATHSNHPRAELVQQQIVPQMDEQGKRKPRRNKGNQWPSAPVVFEEDMDLTEVSPLMAWVFNTEELNQQYLEAVASILEDEFEIDKMMDRSNEIIEFLTTENEERGFWTGKEYEQFVSSAEGLQSFVTKRHEHLWSLLREELQG